jgi:hypothetical protein
MRKRDRISLVVGWEKNKASRLGYEWAEEKGISSALLSSTDVALGAVNSKRMEVTALFKTWMPNRLVVFGDEALTEGGFGRTFANFAEGIGAELVYLESPGLPINFAPRNREYCGEKSPNGRLTCTRYKNHIGKYHTEIRDGQRKGRFEVKHEPDRRQT